MGTSVSPWREAALGRVMQQQMADLLGRGLQSSTSQLNLSRFGHTSPCPPSSNRSGENHAHIVSNKMRLR
jgi:hypothetical protein